MLRVITARRFRPVRPKNRKRNVCITTCRRKKSPNGWIAGVASFSQYFSYYRTFSTGFSSGFSRCQKKVFLDFYYCTSNSHHFNAMICLFLLLRVPNICLQLLTLFLLIVCMFLYQYTHNHIAIQAGRFISSACVTSHQCGAVFYYALST